HPGRCDRVCALARCRAPARFRRMHRGRIVHARRRPAGAGVVLPPGRPGTGRGTAGLGPAPGRRTEPVLGSPDTAGAQHPHEPVPRCAAHDPEAIYPTLARALAEIAGAAAVDVFAADGADGMLRRVALVGPIAQVMLALPMPPRHQDGPAVLAPTLAFMQGAPVIRRNPGKAASGDG